MNDQPITHKNHKGQTFFLHKIPARRGRPDRYVFSEALGEGPVFTMPANMRIVEAETGVLSLVEKGV